MICPSCNGEMEAVDVRKIPGSRYNKIKYYCTLCEVTQWSFPKDRRDAFGEDHAEDVKCETAVKKWIDENQD